MNLEFEGPPGDWIVEGGRPATTLGTKGMPSFEHEDGELVVFDLLVAMLSMDQGLKLFPHWYGTACVIAPDDLVPLHHTLGAWWCWRPQVYSKALLGWERLGSQQELAWRLGLSEMTRIIHTEDTIDSFKMVEADHRAKAVLREHLTPQQRIELLALGSFRVRGAKTRNMYRIRPNHGFAIIDKATGEEVVSYCLHPEAWIPADDVALATKLALEDEDLEVDVLENARYTLVEQTEEPTADDLVAERLEEELIV